MTRKTALLILFSILSLSIFFGSQLPKLSFNYVFEDFFPVDDPDLEVYNHFAGKFENDNDYILIGISTSNGIFKKNFLSQVNALVNELESNKYVTNVFSLTHFKQPVISSAGLFNIPIVHADNDSLLVKDSIRLYNQPEIKKRFVSIDGSSILIQIRHTQFNDKPTADKFVSDVIELVENHDFEKHYFAGKLYAQGIFISKIQTELLVFLSASIALVILFLTIAYRNWWGILVPLIIVMFATIWILGIIVITGKQLDLLMVLLPTIMFVVGMSDVIHLMSKYIENLRRGESKKTAISTALKEVGLATLLTSLTTSIGFLTLLTASIAPIQEFGIYTASGVLIAFLITFLLLPACWTLVSKPGITQNNEIRSTWTVALAASFRWILNHKTSLVIGYVLITMLSAYGISKIVINTYLIEDLPKEDPLKQSFQFFDDQFGGSRPFEAIITVKKPYNLFSPQLIQSIDRIEHHLKDSLEISGLISSNTLLKSLNQATHGGDYHHYKLPEVQNKIFNKWLRRSIKRGEFEGKLYADSLSLGRISGYMDDMGSTISLKRIDDFKQIKPKLIDEDILDVQITGTSLLIDKNNTYLAKNMLQGLGIAFGVVALIAGLLFRSFRMIIITLIPNIIPLLMVAGIMGLFGITLKLSTSIVFTIAFGIAVDDTIHFTSKLKLELLKGKSLIYALKRTYLSTGKAIVITSLVLSGGFLILILSSFGGTFYTGLLISLTLLFALVIDLTLLPALILIFLDKNRLQKPNRESHFDVFQFKNE